MTVEELEKNLKKEQLDSIYLLYGEETFLLETAFKKIKNLFGETVKGINYIEIDDTNLENLIPDMQTPAFGYEKKLVIVKNTGLFKREVKKKGASFVEFREKLITFLKENTKMIKESLIDRKSVV